MLIEKAIDLSDSSQYLYLEKAEVLFLLSSPYEALQTVYYAISLNKTTAEPYSRARAIYAAITMYNRALHFAKTDIARNSYFNNRGNAKAGIRDFKGALQYYEQVLVTDPENIATLNNIAPTYRELGMTRKGIESLEKIISIDPTYVGPYINLGFIYSELDSLDFAISYFDKALKLDPEAALIYSNRGHTYYKKGEYNKALKDMNRSINLYPTTPTPIEIWPWCTSLKTRPTKHAKLWSLPTNTDSNSGMVPKSASFRRSIVSSL